MKRNLLTLLFVIIFLAPILLTASGGFAPARGAPGNGTGVTVKNVATGAYPSSAWTYNLTELNPSAGSKPFTTTFTLSASGGGSQPITGLKAGTYSVTETPKFGYYANINIQSTIAKPVTLTGFSVIIYLVSSEYKTITFTNNAMPAFTLAGLVPPPGNLNYSIPPLKPVPVQASWDVDINNDGRLDLVLGKPTAILVNLTGPSFPSGSSISVSVAFEGNVYNQVVSASTLATNSIVSYYPIVPSSVGNEVITGIYQVVGGTPVNLATTDVTVKNTTDLSLYYAYLTKPSSYGTESQSAFNDMAGNSLNFINSTYPVKNVTANVKYNSIAGSKPGTSRDPFAGMLKDAMAVAQQAQLLMGGSAVGIAIAPPAGSGLPDYFAYHGFPGAAGVSFGPAVKGVIALDGYYTAPAHEVAHTFGLYYGVPEEYQIYPKYGTTTSGVWAGAGAWKTGYDFMGAAPYKTLDLSWVNTTTTYAYLFNKTRVIPNDPDILLANGAIYENGTVEFPLDWVHLQTGTPDTLTPGNYLLKFVNESGNSFGQVSFGVSFSAQIDGGVNQGTNQINATGFSFATTYPPTGTTKIQIVNNTTPQNPIVMATYDMANVKTLSSSASIEGTEGLNGWYVSNVDVTITATADPAVGLREIRYKLDGGEVTVVQGNTAKFTISEDGIHSFEYWGVDSAGRDGVHHTQTVKIDKTAPSISGAATSSPNANGWYKTDVTVHFTASDSISGMGSVTADTTLTGEGRNQHVLGTATDLAGNSAQFDVTGINIDKTPPTITGSRSPGANAYGWNNVSVVVSFDTSDALSSVDPLRDPADVTVSAEGASQYVTGTVYDMAGNSASSTVSGINIDKTAPIISGKTIPDANANGWWKTDVKVEFYVSDALSGLGPNSGNTTLTGEGAGQSVTGTATDKAGNTASATVNSINIDKTPPTLTKGLSGTAGSGGWYTSNVVVTLTGDDTGGSGLSSVEYNLNSGGWAAYTVPFTLSTEGTNTLEHRATDKAGNVYVLPQQTIKIDKTAPTLTKILSGSLGADGWYTSNVVVTLTSDDSGSGVASVEYNLNGTGWIVYSAPFTISTKGTNTLEHRATDIAGNVYVLPTQDIKIAYVFSGFLTPIPGSQYNIGRTVPVKFQLKDSQGNFVTTAVARIYVAPVANDGTLGNYLPGSTKDGTTNVFRYESANNQYMFNLDTSSLSVGQLRIRVDLDDGTSKTVDIILR